MKEYVVLCPNGALEVWQKCLCGCGSWTVWGFNGPNFLDHPSKYSREILSEL